MPHGIGNGLSQVFDAVGDAAVMLRMRELAKAANDANHTARLWMNRAKELEKKLIQANAMIDQANGEIDKMNAAVDSYSKAHAGESELRYALQKEIAACPNHGSHPLGRNKLSQQQLHYRLSEGHGMPADVVKRLSENL